MAYASRTFRIFVSSTFSDLKAERNALQEKVFPRLRELCMQHGSRFQAIDLRWGVSEEATLDQQTINICLGEIERCRRTSPRPNFIVLLGDRYGWKPLPPQIPAHEFDAIRKRISPEEESRLALWYRRDDNAVPAEYCLQPRQGEYANSDRWSAVERELHSILERAVAGLPLDADAQLKYVASATEQEIVHGALRVDDAPEHVFCFFRTIKDLPRDASARDFADLDESGNRDEGAHRQLVELKRKLRAKLPRNTYDYDAAWTGVGLTTDHIAKLCEDVYNSLSRIILEEIAKLEEVEPLDQEIANHSAFGEERTKFFTGRTDILQAIDAYVKSNDRHPLAIWGESGSGKSALMAKIVEHVRRDYPKGEVTVRFIGATPESSNGRAILENLCRQISRRYGADQASIPLEYKDLVGEFAKRLALATTDKPLVLFLDALDQLSNADNARNLIWLPTDLPANVRLIVSTLPGECLTVLERKLPASNRHELRPLAREEGSDLLNLWLTDAGRTLQPEQGAALLSKFSQNGLPLYLKLAFEEARLWRSYDGVRDLGANIPEIIGDLFERLSNEANHGAVMVSHSLGYLAASKNGLTEGEMLEVLSKDTNVMRDFQRRSPKSPEVERLPVVVWSRLYFDLEPYLTERSADGTALLAFYHRQLTEFAVARYLNPIFHRRLAGYFGDQSLYAGLDGAGLPNLRKLSEQPHQEAHGGLSDDLRATLTEFKFLEAKVSAQGVQSLIDDYDLVGSPGLEIPADSHRNLRLIQDTLRLSAYVLVGDQSQLAPQLTGRLLSFEEREIKTLLERTKETKKDPWLRPLTLSFTPAGGPLVRTLVGHTGPVFAVAVTPDGRRAVSGSSDSTLKVWDLERGTELATLKGHTSQVAVVAVTPDGRRAVSGSRDSTLKVWDLERGTELATLKGHTYEVVAVAVMPDGRRAVSASDDGTLKVWDLERGTELATLRHTYVLAVAVTPDGKRVVSGSRDSTLKVWDLERGTVRATLKGHTEDVSAVAVMPDGRRAVSASEDGTLKVWDLERGTVRATLKGHKYGIPAVAVTPDGRRAVSASEDETLKVWDLERGIELATLKGHTDHVTAVALTPDGRRAVSASDDKTLKVWDIERGIELATLKGHTDHVTAVALTPDGRRAVSVSWDNTLKVWDIEHGVEEGTLIGHTSSVDNIALMPDGRRAVSASRDNTLKVWDLTGFKLLATFSGDSEIEACAVAADGSTIVAGEGSGHIHFLRPENFISHPLIVTASLKEDQSIAFGCLHCRTWSEVPASALETEISCPHCGTHLKLNPFTINADWRPIAKAWKGQKAVTR